ncbi:MAG: hypothetical protein HY904_10615 [Deltaproteobacteria bacterium]|nr:hypothetical protein [Deltaproteobacteria bacterium]
MTRLAPLLALVGALLAPSAAGAAEHAWALRLERGPGTPGCPGRARLAAGITARLPYDPWSAAGPGRVDVRIAPEGARLRAVVDMTDGEGRHLGRRVLHESPHRCADLMEAVALTVSLAMDPLRARTTPVALPPDAAPDDEDDPPDSAPPPAEPPPVEPPPSAPPPAEPPPVEPPPSEPPPQPAPVQHAPAVPASPARGVRLPSLPALARPLLPAWRVDVQVRAHALVALGLAPRPQPGGQVGVHLRRGVWEAGLQAGWLLPAGVTRDGATVETQLSTATLSACLRADLASACGLGVLGLRDARGHGAGFLRERQAWLPFVAAGPRLTVVLPYGRATALAFHADFLAVPLLTRLRESATGTTLWTQPPLAVVLGVGHQFSATL